MTTIEADNIVAKDDVNVGDNCTVGNKVIIRTIGNEKFEPVSPIARQLKEPIYENSLTSKSIQSMQGKSIVVGGVTLYDQSRMIPAPLLLQPMGGDIQWSNHSTLNDDQGGSIELGGNRNTKGVGTPYIDFHYKDLQQDFNTRVINDGDGQLSIVAPIVHISGGSIQMDGGKNISGSGRMHIACQEMLYLMGLQGGVVVSKGWGGNGNLTVEGDIFLTGADCAEEFDIIDANSVSPGTVMVINNKGMLNPSQQAYDKKVAGVISGAGDYRPGITLDRKKADYPNRLPIALSGKVFCKVDAAYGQIEVGDLLTTSPTKGHAMKVVDHSKALGTIIGKSLSGFAEGRGLIPILVSLQ